MDKERKLTAKQEAFVLAMLETNNASEAYRRAYDVSRMLPTTVYRKAQEVMAVGIISARLKELRDQAANAAVMDRAGVLSLITEIATADASQLMQVQVRCCRQCWGLGHEHQWKNGTEWGFAVAKVMDDNAKRLAAWELIGKGPRPEPKDLPTNEGGYGFDVTRSPNPECPSCLGEGHETVKLKDTRKLTGAAKRLFAGAKVGKNGIEIKTRDQDHALSLLAKAHDIDKPVQVGVAVQAQVVQNTAVINADPQQASRAYLELMKEE